MSELVVLAFPTRPDAERAYDLMMGDLTKQGLIQVGDAAIAWRGADGKPQVRQAVDLTAVGAASGALWGTLIGALFLMPIFGLAVGAATGALSGKLTDIGINDEMVKEIAAALEPGSAAVFLLVVKATADRVIEAIAPYSPRVLQTSLSHDREQELIAALKA